MRALFGGDPMLTETNGIVRLNASSRTMTLWDSEAGGTQYTDLRAFDGVTIIDSVPVSGKTTPPFYGEDNDLQYAWADTGDGTRELIRGTFPPGGGGLTLEEASTEFAGRGTQEYATKNEFNWTYDYAGTGYLFHLTSGPNTTSGTALIGVGLEEGNGATGILVSNKSSGIGLNIASQPGAGKAINVTSWSAESPLHADIRVGADPVTLAARVGEGFNDGASTSGSTTFTSATANFTAADVGSAVTQLTTTPTSPSGSLPAGATIASVESATSVTLSAPATATGSAIRFLIQSRTPADDQAILRLLDTDLIAKLFEVTRSTATINTAVTINARNTSTVPLTLKSQTGQTSNVFEVYMSGVTTPIVNVTGDKGILQALSTIEVTNANRLGTRALTATTLSSNGAIRATQSGGGQGNLFEAYPEAAGKAVSRFSRDGYFMTSLNAAPADGQLGNGEAALWLDSTSGATKLMVKAKDAGGTVRTGSVALA